MSQIPQSKSFVTLSMQLEKVSAASGGNRKIYNNSQREQSTI